MPKSVTNAEFMRSASWIAKHAASWVGEGACNIVGGLDKADDQMRPEALVRFRESILAHLNAATGHEV